MSETIIKDEGNGILIIENDIASVKSDTNRKIYCKNNLKNTSYKYINFELPQGLSRDKKREHLVALHVALTEYNSKKQDEQNESHDSENDEADEQ